jgi:peptidoglycan/LPS O-acetylase OafA/YrhL
LTVSTSTRTPPRHASAFAYQPALDGVRALSVAAVLLFHGGVAWLPGGFLGVDAFFVLSGFLITSLLLAEHSRDGRVRLGSFWLRRARRLLPALLLVVLFVAFTFRSLLTALDLRLLRDDALAALGYVANWRMIYRGDDYFTQTAAPSALQHTWSLGIEEQFYVLWPLIVVGVLAVGARSRSLLLGLCLAGAAVSAAVGVLLYDPFNVNRAYFGTDTRAQALLIGCALAVLLSSRPAGADRPAAAAGARSGGHALGLLALVSAAAVGFLWMSTDGAGPFLYRGGFALGGVAVAIVLAHAVLSPGAPLSRLLAVTPLVWLGKISYGVYLWHWPLYALITADRTGASGTALLVLRLLATLVLATLSYLLVEQPIRTGRWPFPMPRLSRLAAGASATAAVGVTAATVLVATSVPAVATIASLRTAPLLVTAPNANQAVPPPMLRPGRREGALPRISFFGDSVSWSLGFYLPSYKDELEVSVNSLEGCGIARLPEIRVKDMPQTNYSWCPEWDATWRARLNVSDPDVAVLLLGRWELMDRKLGGRFQHVGEPDFDTYLRGELNLAVSILLSKGAHVVILTAPYNRRYERPNGELYDEDLPERVDAWNRLLLEVAAKNDDRTTVIDLNKRVCPDGEFTSSIDRLRIRSDGLHFTPDGVRRYIAPWLMPQLARIATGAVYAVERGD